MGRTVLGSNRGRGKRSYCSPERPNWGPSSNLFSGYGSSFPGVKTPWREVNYVIHPTSPEVKNKCSYTSTPHIRLNDVDRENIYIYIHTHIYIYT
jgi:hypothetical protein